MIAYLGGGLSVLGAVAWIGSTIYFLYVAAWRVPRARRRRDIKLALVCAVEGSLPLEVQRKIWEEYWREAWNEDWRGRG